VGQQVAQLALSHFGFGQQSDRIGKAAEVVQKGAVELLGIYDVIYAIAAFERIHLLVHGFVEKLLPSLKFLLSLFSVFLHFILPIGFEVALPAARCAAGRNRLVDI
jgi:hypothetical protein